MTYIWMCLLKNLTTCLPLLIYKLESAEAYIEPGGYSIKFYTRRLSPEDQPLTLLYTIFGRKGTAIVYLLRLTNDTPFTYLGQNIESLNCCKCTDLI